MPTFDINTFSKGLITAADQEDIPSDAASYSENIDGDAVEGRLQGIPGYTSKSTDAHLKLMGQNAWLRRDTGEFDLIYNDGTDIRALSDFYGTPSESQILAGVVGTSFVAQNKAVHIGTGSDASHPPKWVGRCGWTMFGGVGSITYTNGGGGLDDLRLGGGYTGAANDTGVVEVTNHAVGGDTIRWSLLSIGFHTTIVLIAANQNPDGTFNTPDGIKLFFSIALNGHVAGDKWTFPVTAKGSSIIGKNAELVTYENFGTPSGGQFKLFGALTAAGTTIPNRFRRYKFSVIYEGVQESLLSAGQVDLTPTAGDKITITMFAKNATSAPSGFDPRITSINIYCAISSDTSANNIGLYHLVTSFVIANNREATYNPTQYFTQDFSDHYSCSAINVDVDGLVGVSYEANSGLLENSDTTIVNYSLNAAVSGFLFTGKNYTPFLPDANRMIFRSRALAFDSFDIVNDHLIIPILPTAMAGFNGKLYVWDLNTTIIINPQGLYIENIISGKGCTSQTSWTVIDVEGTHALVFCDYNNCYITDGSGIKAISDPVKKASQSSTVSWQSMDHSIYSPIVVFDSPRNTLLFITKKGVGQPVHITGTGLSDIFVTGTYSGTTNDVYYFKITTANDETDKFAWKKGSGGSYSAEITMTGSLIYIAEDIYVDFSATTGHTLNDVWTVAVNATYTTVWPFHVTKKRWEYWPNFTNSLLVKGAVSGKTGETYCSNGSALLNNFGDTTANRAWLWISQQVTFNSANQRKRFSHLYVEVSSTGTITPLFGTGSGTPATGLTGNVITGMPYANSLKIKLSGTAALNFVTSLSILYRILRGQR